MADPDPTERDQWAEFGEWIFRRRVADLGWSRREAAEATGLSISTLQNLEEGGRTYRGEWLVPSPSVATLRALAKGLTLPMQEVFARAGRDLVATNLGLDDRASPAALTDKLDRLTSAQRETIERLVDELLGPDE